MSSAWLIDTETLAQNLGRKDLVVIDVRGEAAYSSHIPGAINSTWHAYSDPEAVAKGVLDPDISRLERRLQALGINNSSDIVIYSNPFDNWGDEGRMFWMLQYLGHSSVKILDGGWVKWTTEARPYQHDPIQLPPGDFKATPHTEIMILKDELKKLVKRPHPESILIDARSIEEYAGKEIDGLPRAGHIPSAVNIPWNGFLNRDGTVKDFETIRNIFLDNGLRPEQEIITYCLGGVRSAWLYFVLRLVGYEKVRNYPGSWWEWSRDFAAPTEKDVKLLHKVTAQSPAQSS
ncbi:sulfurtransferase [Candidatus Nitronereus thalassa]|uniref:Sulfurtransferase n=1 Tax=Candidatus Nitronereus thalassa TaxID=3020898 RepID=A0ABU3KAL6_9BACT|nr:sulfurtransferase [Candidatus Nitronereus thalassa]MDT7043514.1 sulfurtransferase [Candidatus Nitronereus thalassa]